MFSMFNIFKNVTIVATTSTEKPCLLSANILVTQSTPITGLRASNSLDTAIN